MTLVLTMAGKYKRFRDFSYQIPKYLLPLSNRSILYFIIDSFNIPLNFNRVLLVANNRDIRFISQIKSILNEFECKDSEVIFISDTRGQSETALKSLEYISGKSADDSVTIHNIDTILLNRDYSKLKKDLSETDCLIDTFYSNNSSYSYVLSENNSVQEIIEKQKISDKASSGCYSFSSLKQTIYYLKKSKNFYISDSISAMIKDGKNVSLINNADENSTFVLGTPEEYINSMAYFDLIRGLRK